MLAPFPMLRPLSRPLFVPALTGGYSAAVLADSPVAYWRLGESIGTSAADASGNSQTGTYGGGFTLGATGLITGDSNTAVSLSSGYVSIPDSGTLRPASLTVEAWIKLSGTPSFASVCSKAKNGPPWSSPYVSWLLRINSNTSIECDVGNASTYNAVSYTVSALGTTKHHVALTYDQTTCRLYLDGSLAGSSTAVSGAVSYGTPPVLIGADYGSSPRGDYFPGTIDEVAIYGTALSSTRIAAHYTAGL